MRTIKIVLVAVIGLLFISLDAYSLTYTSMTDGSWSNTTSVWSNDGGYTSCNCSPALNVVTDTIVIHHRVYGSGNVEFQNALAYMWINNMGALVMPTQRLTVSSGKVNSFGTLRTSRLVIGAGAKVTVTDGIIDSGFQINVYGTFNNTNSLIQIGFGDFTVYADGMASFQSGSYLRVTGGHIYIAPGAILNDDYSCLYARGNINNEGTVTGYGGVVTSYSGNIINHGVWSVDVDWCVPGTSTNMPILEKCLYVDVLCGDIITAISLPIDLVLFDANGTPENNVEIEWVTASEINNDFFTVENSVDQEIWNEVTIVPGAGNSNTMLSYMYLDQDPLNGLSYYRLKQTDHDGAFAYSEVRAVNITGTAPTQFVEFVELYPNPSSGNITWTLNTAMTGEYKLSIYDNLSRKVLSKDLYLEQGITSMNLDVSSFSGGTYSMVISATNVDHVVSKLLMVH